MSEVATAQPDLVTELKVSAHLMRLEPGVYCVYHSEGSQLPDPATGLPGARLSLPPGPTASGVVISGFRDDGWISNDSASLIRVSKAPAHVLVTVYQMPGSGYEPPRMQVRRLIEGSAAASPEPPQAAVSQETAADPANDQDTVTGGKSGAVPPEPEIAAHIQLRGDVLARVGDWIGDPGSQRWIEGFAVAPRGEVPIEDIEYQAVLGRGWLSPWAEGGQYCGSRGMALPILGLRARLRGASNASHALQISATFTDGSKIGPVAAGEPCEAESLAPLEAFRLTIRPIGQAEEPVEPAAAGRKTPAAKTRGKKRVEEELDFAAESMVGEAPIALVDQPEPKSGSKSAAKSVAQRGSKRVASPAVIAAKSEPELEPEPDLEPESARAGRAKPSLAKPSLAKPGRKAAAAVKPAAIAPAPKRGGAAKGRRR